MKPKNKVKKVSKPLHKWRKIGQPSYDFGDALWQCEKCKLVIMHLGQPEFVLPNQSKK